MQSDSKSLRPVDVDSLVHPKEKIYFAICVVVSVIIYYLLVRVVLSGAQASGVILFYIVAGIVGYFIFHGLMLGQIRGNGIRVSARQFPELMTMANQHARRLARASAPPIRLEAGSSKRVASTDCSFWPQPVICTPRSIQPSTAISERPRPASSCGSPRFFRLTRTSPNASRR